MRGAGSNPIHISVGALEGVGAVANHGGAGMRKGWKDFEDFLAIASSRFPKAGQEAEADQEAEEDQHEDCQDEESYPGRDVDVDDGAQDVEKALAGGVLIVFHFFENNARAHFREIYFSKNNDAEYFQNNN